LRQKSDIRYSTEIQISQPRCRCRSKWPPNVKPVALFVTSATVLVGNPKAVRAGNALALPTRLNPNEVTGVFPIVGMFNVGK